MKAAIISEPGRLDIVDAPQPTPTANRALIQVEGCGVCASNLSRWEGKPWFTYPTSPGELGHEGVGKVVALGDEVDTWKVGDRVAFLSNHAYAEYDLAAANEMVRMPDTLAGFCVPGEPLACAWNIFHRAAVRPKDNVAIVGGGFLACLLIQLAVHSGARVIAVTRRPLPPEFFREIGSFESVSFEDAQENRRKVEELTVGLLCDVVIEAAGKQAPLDLAAQLTRTRGRLIIAGYHQDGPRQVDMQLWNWRGLDVINAHERDPQMYVEGMRRAYTAVDDGTLKPLPLLTHQLPLSDLAEAFELARQRPAGFMKAVVHP
jgi:threonine dehydrogenase-like Zn-dependent dehydrogenase